MAKVVQGIAGLLGISGATYGILVYSDVLKAEKAAFQKKLKADDQLAKKEGVQAQIRQAESGAELLMKDCHSLQQIVAETDAKLQEARAEVNRLETLREESGEKQHHKQSELKSTLSRISLLQKDYFRHSEAYTVADREYQEAQRKASQLAHEKNPLNHPQVKEWWQQRSS